MKHCGFTFREGHYELCPHLGDVLTSSSVGSPYFSLLARSHGTFMFYSRFTLDLDLDLGLDGVVHVDFDSDGIHLHSALSVKFNAVIYFDRSQLHRSWVRGGLFGLGPPIGS